MRSLAPVVAPESMLRIAAMTPSIGAATRLVRPVRRPFRRQQAEQGAVLELLHGRPPAVAQTSFGNKALAFQHADRWDVARDRRPPRCGADRKCRSRTPVRTRAFRCHSPCLSFAMDGVADFPAQVLDAECAQEGDADDRIIVEGDPIDQRAVRAGLQARFDPCSASRSTSGPMSPVAGRLFVRKQILQRGGVVRQSAAV